MEEFFNRKDESGNTKVNKPSTFQKLQKLIAEKLKRLYFKNIPDDSIQEMQPICKIKFLFKSFGFSPINCIIYY